MEKIFSKQTKNFQLILVRFMRNQADLKSCGYQPVREPAVLSKVLGIVYRVIATYLLKKAGFNKRQAETGAVTLIQRFGSSLNLNIHFHMLFFDGVYVKEEENLRFVYHF